MPTKALRSVPPMLISSVSTLLPSARVTVCERRSKPSEPSTSKKSPTRSSTSPVARTYWPSRPSWSSAIVLFGPLRTWILRWPSPPAKSMTFASASVPAGTPATRLMSRPRLVTLSVTSCRPTNSTRPAVAVAAAHFRSAAWVCPGFGANSARPKSTSSITKPKARGLVDSGVPSKSASIQYGPFRPA